jgi:predicted extracellular nuclease
MAPPGTLYFSEYVEGSSNNKALEIYNAGGTAIDLSTCEIDRYQNGATTASPAIMLTATTLPPGGVFVICNTSFAQLALCDQTSGSVQHTGNDVVELVCGGTLKDAIGTVGDANVWGTPPTTTQDATLRRKCSVTVGDTNPNDAFDPAVEWDGFPIDTFTDLGQYVCP